MKVDAPGLVAAAQRLVTAVEALGGSVGVPHPPLAADPASVGAAGRLTTAGAELAAALAAHVSALVVSVEQLTGAAMTYVGTDELNAAAITGLDIGAIGSAPVTGSAPPAPPIPADARAPIPPPVGMAPEAISAAAHAGAPGAGESFTAVWTEAAGAARNAAVAIRSAVNQLPEVLDGPASTPAVSRHLLSFADGLDSYADRGHRLARQASTHAGDQGQAREDIPSPAQFTFAHNKIQNIASANAASGGRYAAQLAQAVSEKQQLDERAVTGFAGYHQRTDASTAGDELGAAEANTPGSLPSSDPAAGDGAGLRDQGAGLASPETAGAMGSMLPGMLGSMGGMAGGLAGGVTRVPQSLMQAGMHGIGAATRGLSGSPPHMDSPGGPADLPGDGGSPGDLGGGGDATTPAGGDGAPELGVAPSTGSPPTPAITPAGATAGPAPEPGGGGGRPMGMPMGAMGGLGGAPGGGGGEGKDKADRRKLVVPEVAHTEDVTGRVDPNRLSVTLAGSKDHNPEPPDGPAPEAGAPIVRRLVTRTPKEPS